jgi:hypothetical protein
MDVNGPGFSVDGDPDKIHARIQAELSTDQILWLEKQSRLIDKTELLRYAVMEWWAGIQSTGSEAPASETLFD